MTAPFFKPLPDYRLTFKDKVLDLSTPKVMGVLNVTPDSFSDGGRFNSVDRAVAHARQLVLDGADIIDIGGESTRPNATPVLLDDELARVVPVVRAVRQELGDKLWLSVDTSSPAVMEQAIMAGADMINDVRALSRDGACQMASDLACPVVLMHSRGEPSTMGDLAVYDDVVADVVRELSASIDRAVGAGVKSENIVIDVGMGFAKHYAEHKRLMNELSAVGEMLNYPMLFGVSRKRFLGELLGQMPFANLQNHTPSDRDGLGVLAHFVAVLQGASIVRVHDVKMMSQAAWFWRLMAQK